MRQSGLLLASMALALLLVSGVAWAVVKDCRAGADYCVGTNQKDTLNGSEVRDKIYGKDDNDKLFGNSGNDALRGGRGDDTMKGGAGKDDFSYSNPGTDGLYGGSGDDFLWDNGSLCSNSTGECTDELNRLYGGSGKDFLLGNTRLLVVLVTTNCRLTPTEKR